MLQQTQPQANRRQLAQQQRREREHAAQLHHESESSSHAHHIRHRIQIISSDSEDDFDGCRSDDSQMSRHGDDSEDDVHGDNQGMFIFALLYTSVIDIYHKFSVNFFAHTTGPLCAAWRRFLEASVQQHYIGPMNATCPYCNAFHWVQERTYGSTSNPSFGMCCDRGKVRLDPLPNPPEALRNLLDYTNITREAVEFRANIAQYNSALAFTSVGVQADEHVNHVGQGQPVFRIHGELRHWSGTLLPRENTAPSYAQLYILDPRSAQPIA